MKKNDDMLVDVIRKMVTFPPQKAGGDAAREYRSPASKESVVYTEAVIGLSFDSLLSRVYLEVCDGGFGPGHGSLPLIGNNSISSTYASFRLDKWPNLLVPVWDWGDAIWSCVDDDGNIVTHDDVVGPTLTEFDVRSWLWAWVDGVDIWSELYEDYNATIINPFTRKPILTKVRGRAKGRPWKI